MESGQELRERVGRKLLAAVGVVLTPSFEAALWPGPKEKLVTGGLQAGKSVLGAADVFVEIAAKHMAAAARRETMGALDRTWVIVPNYDDKNKEMVYLAEWWGKLGALDSFSQPRGEAWTIRALDGQVVVESRTGVNPVAISGEECDRVLIVETGRMPEIVRTQALARVLIKGGRVIMTGTLEQDEARAQTTQYAWYGELASAWAEAPSEAAMSFSLPTWANPCFLPGPLCLLRAEGCEGHEHGRRHPNIEALEKAIGDDFTFLRRHGGLPVGQRWKVYPWLRRDGFFDRPSVPEGAKWIRGLASGGHDFGSGYEGKHPSTLAVATVGGVPIGGNAPDDIWIREVRENFSADEDWIQSNKRELSAKYWVPSGRWAYDPMQREAAQAAGAVVATGEREVRVGLVEARGLSRRIFFDMSGPGVSRAFDQMMRVHRVKEQHRDGNVVYAYARVDDDMVAAIEDLVQIIDGKAKPLDYSPLAQAPDRVRTAAGSDYKPRIVESLR